MKKNRHIYVIAIVLLSTLLLTACSLMGLDPEPTPNEQQTLEAKVKLTMTAIALEETMTPTEVEETPISPSPTQAAPTSTQTAAAYIEGEIAYPSEFLPPQRVVAFDINDTENYFAAEVRSGSTYLVEVPAGSYYVLSYLLNPAQVGASPDLRAAFSQAVLCGLGDTCEDHSLVEVEVMPGETVSDINPVDWYLPQGEDAGWPSDPFNEGVGSISGDLGYPSEYIPPLRVIAFDVNSQGYYYVDTLLNQSTYEITDLPPGTYHVLAYVMEDGPDLSAGYTYFVTCGMTVDCDNHNLIDVLVYPGEETENVDPVDFYTQPGQVDWPENPTQ